MCDACLALIDAAGSQARQLVATSNDSDVRERVAKLLTVSDGVCPETLVANTLDEEPVDGLLAFGQEAHFAWRQRLHRADGLCGPARQLAVLPIANNVGSAPASWGAVRHGVAATLPGTICGTSPA